ncbi:hypothetical protein ZIOFF_061864 [Zingiber officinale]|uniref:DUF3741 domain-containing protein n=1 Tax=Zingiber officinale TaxID=94328 RepID=A0A8J5KDW4_ZINOF|nr:hypothetical protein ZIOFF_061864 [Zingiber officinale]
MRSIYPVVKDMEGEQETGSDIESRLIVPGVVARLMGLDSMAVQNSMRRKAKARNKNCLSTGFVGEFHQCQWQEGGNSMPCEVHSFAGEEDCRDIYEVEQPLKNT